MTLIQTSDTITTHPTPEKTHNLATSPAENLATAPEAANAGPRTGIASETGLTIDAKHHIELPPLPVTRPLLMVGHGTRNPKGRQDLIDFAKIYQSLDGSRPVIPCFLELTEPNIQAGVDQCVEQGYTDISVLPILLFAARHNKFDVTNELDRAKARHPQITFHYGRHFGITPAILELWQDRLAMLDRPKNNPNNIAREETVLLFIGRGSSDPDANGDLAKLARMMWEGSGYHTVETCFIGITHPRLEEGFRRARLYTPKRIVVLPYFMFTGVLMEKIERITTEQQAMYPEAEVAMLPEMGIHPQLLRVLRDREIETQQGAVNMNCEMCKFRIAATTEEERSGHGHDHGAEQHGHGHHGHNHGADADPYAEPEQYHNRIWQVP